MREFESLPGYQPICWRILLPFFLLWLELSYSIAQKLSSRIFDLELRRYRSEGEGRYTKKQRRAFQRLMSGLTVGKSRSERLRFMTLTSSPESKDRNLNADFRTLKMRILRKYHFKMKYWKIRTNEGNGVLHIVFRGKYILKSGLAHSGLTYTTLL